MTRNDILRMADEADLLHICDLEDKKDCIGIDTIIKFAELVAAAEREMCAKLCDVMADGWENNPGTNPLAGYIASSNCAVEIRARRSSVNSPQD